METPGRMFDLEAASKKYGVSTDILDQMIKQAREDFGSDDMMMELHVIRAMHAYAENAKKASRS